MGLKKHFDDYAKKIVKDFKLKSNSFCVDIGSNDGSMLASLKKQKMNVIGVEPCYNISKKANKNGLKTINSFFDKKTVDKIKSLNGPAKLITLNYIYANVDNILEFTSNLKNLLAYDGILVIETGYHPKQMKNKMFDYVYHEHFSYFTLQNIKFIFDTIGLELLSATVTKPKGGSLRIVAQHYDGTRKQNNSINSIIAYEKKFGVKKINTYKKFFKSIEKRKKIIREKLNNFKKQGKKIVALGASHSTTVMLYHFGIRDSFKYIVDDNKKKHNLYSPGYHIPVYSTGKIYRDKVDVVFILAWQHQNAIMKKHKRFLKTNGIFVVPLPNYKEVEYIK